MAKNKNPVKEKRVMIKVSELDKLKQNQLRSCSDDAVTQEFMDRVMKPFDKIVDELERKRDDIDDLKDEIRDLAD